MTSMQQPYGTFSNPITKAGRVIYNASADFYEIQKRKKGKRKGDNLELVMPENIEEYRQKNDITDENFSIQPHEVLVMTKKPKLKRSHNDTDVQTISSANAMLTKYDARDVVQGDAKATAINRMKRVRSKLTFGGIANNRAQYDSYDRNRQENHFATQFGGLCTIMNTGKDVIRAGDLVMWDMPVDISAFQGADEVTTNVNRKYDGLPRTKAIFPINKYEVGMEVATLKNCKALRDFYGIPANSPVTTQLPQKTVGDLDALARIFDAHQRDVRDRIIGKAMSSSEPNKPLDLLLGHYMA